MRFLAAVSIIYLFHEAKTMEELTALDNNLTTHISATIENISDKTEELAKFKSDLKSFLEANAGLNMAICQDVDDALNPTELLAEIEILQALENTRLQKLANVNKASALLENQIDKAANELEQLQRHLARLNEEKEWEINYLPSAYKYSSTFTKDFKNQSDRKLIGYKNQISSYSQQLDKIRYFLGDPNPKNKLKFCKVGDLTSLGYEESEKALTSIPGHISGLENAIRRELDDSERWLNGLENNPDFRAFVRARVDIDFAAREFKCATDEYLEKLQCFKELKEKCNRAIKYSENSGYSSNRITSVIIDDFIKITDIEINV